VAAAVDSLELELELPLFTSRELFPQAASSNTKKVLRVAPVIRRQMKRMLLPRATLGSGEK
jgi:hypothetical protein